MALSPAQRSESAKTPEIPENREVVGVAPVEQRDGSVKEDVIAPGYYQ